MTSFYDFACLALKSHVKAADTSLRIALQGMALYEDEYVRLDETSVTIRYYYFPLGGDNIILRESIQEIQALENPSIFETKTWGMGLSSVWWALGWKLNIEAPKKLFVIRIIDDWVGKGFVCCDSSAFMAAYRQSAQVR